MLSARRAAERAAEPRRAQPVLLLVLALWQLLLTQQGGLGARCRFAALRGAWQAQAQCASYTLRAKRNTRKLDPWTVFRVSLSLSGQRLYRHLPSRWLLRPDRRFSLRPTCVRFLPSRQVYLPFRGL